MNLREFNSYVADTNGQVYVMFVGGDLMQTSVKNYSSSPYNGDFSFSIGETKTAHVCLVNRFIAQTSLLKCHGKAISQKCNSVWQIVLHV